MTETESVVKEREEKVRLPRVLSENPVVTPEISLTAFTPYPHPNRTLQITKSYVIPREFDGCSGATYWAGLFRSLCFHLADDRVLSLLPCDVAVARAVCESMSDSS
ncbi:hypothetical protein BaRGS_00026312 [Batillaria attramentaria]|uniref:Uncharacterized protein n=1 Tax=Batillaria attramentaria TaxID=370345 RepID=A0ABD0K511_9CAEN